MAQQNGDRTPDNVRPGRERKPLLAIPNPGLETALAGLVFDDADISEVRRFGNGLLAARNFWHLGRPNQLAGHRLLRGEAERLLRFRLAELAKGGAE